MQMPCHLYDDAARGQKIATCRHLSDPSSRAFLPPYSAARSSSILRTSSLLPLSPFLELLSKGTDKRKIPPLSLLEFNSEAPLARREASTMLDCTHYRVARKCSRLYLNQLQLLFGHPVVLGGRVRLRLLSLTLEKSSFQVF